MGLRSTDSRLKRMALSLIWGTEQLSKKKKVTKLESILKNANDVSLGMPLIYFMLLPVVPPHGIRPMRTKTVPISKQKSRRWQRLKPHKIKFKISEQTLSEFRTSNAELTSKLTDADELKRYQEALIARRSDLNTAVSGLRGIFAIAEEQYREAIESAEDAHKASMESPLSKKDKKSWSDACARRDELVESYH